ncbi:MAG: hypothetical protein KIT73_06830 [Burkholderiales bacterium]|nr:hypothetical protein [Burkholderiales bacterium]
MSAALESAAAKRGREMAGRVKEHCPELVPFLKELHALGMIDGWRSVTYCGPVDGAPQYHAAPSTLFGNELLAWNAAQKRKDRR